MKNYILFFLIFICFRLNATRQRTDKLEYNNMHLDVHIGWGHPSPLETYFIQNQKRYPFQGLGTNNYRGHIASWKIKDGKLFLTQIEIENSIRIISEYDIKSKNDKFNSPNCLFADWFSGLISCRLYDTTNDNDVLLKTFYFLVREGNIVDSLQINGRDSLHNSKLSIIDEKYQAFYYRLKEDRIIYHDTVCKLNTGWSKLSPIFAYYGDNLLKWPFNWENIERSGAPYCEWLIKDNKLYLTNLILHIGTRFDTIYKDTIDLKKEFPNKVESKIVFASWVNGVYLALSGKDTVSKRISDYKYFKTEKYIFLRIKQGFVIESFSVNDDFDFEKIPDNFDSKQKKIIKDYFNN